MPSGLVVKKGSKSPCAAVEATPTPPSQTETCSVLPTHAVRTMTGVVERASRVASIALRVRFTSTCSSWIGSAKTWGSSGANSAINLVSISAAAMGGRQDLISARTSRTKLLRSTMTRRELLLCTNAPSRRTISLARSVWSRIFLMRRATSSGSGPFPSWGHFRHVRAKLLAAARG